MLHRSLTHSLRACHCTPSPHLANHTTLLTATLTTNTPPPSQQHKPPTSNSSNLNNTLLNSILQKDQSKHNPSSTDSIDNTTDTTDTTDSIAPPSPPPPPKQNAFKTLAVGIPVYFGLWAVTCGSIYTAVKTNNLDTQALMGMDRSYAVDQVVNSLEWWTGQRPSDEQIANQDINDILLALSITNLTSPFRLIMTMMLLTRPGKDESSK